VRGVIRGAAWWTLTLAACVVAPCASAQELEPTKQVLVLNSARLDEQFSQTSEREMPKLLAAGLGKRFEYYTEYFDANRFPHPEYETLYVDFLRQKYDGKHIDLLILMGGVALEFMGRHRSELFADAPVVFYALVPPSGPFPNATGLLNRLRFGPSIDLALALQPDLEHVYVVAGATEADHAFERQANAEFRRFEGRLQFTYLSGLVTKDLEARIATLPPRSAVYYAVVTEDGAGEAFQQMAYLTRVAARANAPTYSWSDVSVDTGITGGRRRDQVHELRTLAALAARVVRGERADSIPVSSPDTDADSVDWRQLRRWGLDESRIPPGVQVLFRSPSLWSQYKQYLIGTMMLLAAETALIAALLVQRAKRQRVEIELRASERELHGSQAKLRTSYDRIRHLNRRLLGEQETERARIARELHDDVAQQLAILSIELDLLRSDQWQVQRAEGLSRALETTQGIATSIRELSHRLHPSRLRSVGLVASLDNLRRDLSPAHLPIAFNHQDVPADIDQGVALCLFRVAQEALANAAKHSHASHIWVELSGGPSCVALTIADDGKGFDVDGVANAGLGLISMRERVESIGGLLTIQTTPALGTRLTVTVPTLPSAQLVTAALS
jgi:signal transduction histidine kinase